MNRLLKFAAPGALGLLLAMPAMAQSNQNDNWQGSNNYRNQSWQHPDNQFSSNYRNNGYQNSSNNGYQNSGMTNEAVSQDMMAAVQRRLQQQGFYRQGSVDGVWGPDTENALGNFQQQNNLRPSGKLDLQTLDALNLIGNDNNNNRNMGYNDNMGRSNNMGYGQNDYNQNQNGQDGQYHRGYGTNYSANQPGGEMQNGNGSNR